MVEFGEACKHDPSLERSKEERRREVMRMALKITDLFCYSHTTENAAIVQKNKFKISQLPIQVSALKYLFSGL